MRVYAYINQEINEALAARAAKSRRSKSSVITMILEDWFDDLEGPIGSLSDTITNIEPMSTPLMDRLSGKPKAR